MESMLLTYCGFLTLFLLGTILFYEEKIKKNDASAYLNSNQAHYTYLQIENSKLKEEVEQIRKTSEYWQRAYQLAKPQVYEYTSWKPNTFSSTETIITTDKTN